jgi:hypothetical protein
MNPKTGLYEQLIDVMLAGRLQALPDGTFAVQLVSGAAEGCFRGSTGRRMMPPWN